MKSKRFSVIFVFTITYIGAILLFLQFFNPNQVLTALLILTSLLFFLFTVYIIQERYKLGKQIEQVAKKFQLPIKKSWNKSYREVTSELFNEIEKVLSALAAHKIEMKVKNQQELNQVLQETAESAYKLLQAEAVELILKDKVSDQFYSSFVLGKPSEVTNQILEQPICFAGKVFGNLRVQKRKDDSVTPTDKKVIELLALNTSVAILNSEFNEQIKNLEEQSMETQRARTGFLANLSHEIRAPLSLIINANELLLDNLCGELNSEQRETTELIKSNGEHLLELINDVLEYAKLEAGKVVPKTETINLNDLLEDIVNLLRSNANKKNQTIEFNQTKELIGVSCDRKHLRQIMINLISNAIKYTPEKGLVKIWVESDSKNSKIKINVSDNGIGIKKSDYHKIFKAFERINESYSVNQLGTGLGLSLSKKLVEANNGSIQFNSKTGEGSHFWFYLQKASLNSLDQEPTETINLKSGNGEKILLCINNVDESELLKKYLKKNGYKLLEAKNWEQIEKLTGDNDINLLIVDNSTFESNGSQQNIKKINEKNKEHNKSRVPILLITSKAFEEDVEKYLHAGVDLCIAKPSPLVQLLKACNSLINN